MFHVFCRNCDAINKGLLHIYCNKCSSRDVVIQKVFTFLLFCCSGVVILSVGVLKSFSYFQEPETYDDVCKPNVIHCSCRNCENPEAFVVRIVEKLIPFPINLFQNFVFQCSKCNMGYDPWSQLNPYPLVNLKSNVRDLPCCICVEIK